MEANELRIGNYIQKNGLKATVEIINGEVDEIYYLGDDFYYSDSIDDLRPIPLNEEWLLNFGFEMYEFDNKANQFRLKDRLIVYREGCLHDYGTSVKLEFVHQLQNLYFFLTNTELQC